MSFALGTVLQTLGDATPGTFLTQILQLLFGGFSETATGMGGGIVAMVTSIFTTGEGTWTLNTFGALIVIFASIALALSLFVLLKEQCHVERRDKIGVICWKPLRAYGTFPCL